MSFGGFFILADTLTPLFAEADVITDAEDELSQQAPDILEYAKANAPWSDITGAARESLDVDVYRDGDEIVLELYHGVEYGIWLETIQSGKYAIIMPTLEHFSGQVLRSVDAVETGMEEPS